MKNTEKVQVFYAAAKNCDFPLLYLKCLIQVDRGYSHGKKKGNAFKIALGPACVTLTFMNYSTVWTFFFTFTERQENAPFL